MDSLIITIIKKEMARRIHGCCLCTRDPLHSPTFPPFPSQAHLIPTCFSDTKSFPQENLSLWRPCISACTIKTFMKAPLQTPCIIISFPMVQGSKDPKESKISTLLIAAMLESFLETPMGPAKLRSKDPTS